MEYKIEYNKAIEFIGAVFKYGTNKQQQNNWNSKELQGDLSKGLLDFSPSKYVKDWLKHVDENISPFLRNDIVFIVAKVPGVLDFCFELAVKKDLNGPQELIKSLKDIGSIKIIQTIFENYNLDMPFESENEIIKNALISLYNEEISSLFMQIKNHPEEFKNKVIEAFKTFYELYYKPYEDKVYDIMDRRCIEHNKLFHEDPLYFLNTIGIGDYSKIVVEDKALRMFVSFYVDIGLFHYIIDDVFILFFGHTIEHRFENKLNQEKCKALFKALSDEKRLEIIKITSKRPWYNKELADYFNLTTATLSYHLNLLLDLGILNFEPSFNNRYYYTTNKEHLKKLFEMAFNEIVD
ncbi:winged helix-turn-helix domain-containing protein [Proteiniborus sp.]|uniref:winged helix-turn-helix domain-containing protein n=1 Tax=Proteiniborus sp. TaxID=2079015 RepID=UPI00332FB6D4